MCTQPVRQLASVLLGSLLAVLALAPALAAARPSAQDIARSEALCQQGRAEECLELAGMYAVGTDVLEDLTRADSFARRGCQLGSAGACDLQQKVETVQANREKAGANIRKLMVQDIEECEHGAVDNCVVVALYSTFFVDAQTAENRLNQYLDKACAIDAAAACKFAIGFRKQSTPDRAGDMDARRIVPRTCEKACDAKSSQACELLAEVYGKGWFVPQDPQRAQQVLLRACQLGATQACEQAGVSPPVGAAGGKKGGVLDSLQLNIPKKTPLIDSLQLKDSGSSTSIYDSLKLKDDGDKKSPEPKHPKK